MEEYLKKHPNPKPEKVIRDFHNELSGLFIRKYADLFDIPSEDLLFAIIQISRGHRKTNLFDETEYPDIQTSDGVIRTSYLAGKIQETLDYCHKVAVIQRLRSANCAGAGGDCGC
nr:hypothetical protein [Oribacterium sp. P6A1]